MAHDLATINGQVAMAYQGETPWHGLGKRVKSLTSVTQALDAANLNWNVGLQPMFFKRGEEFVKSEDRRVVIRDVDGAELGTVGAGYHTVQNSEAFEVLQPACEKYGVTIESAGAIKGGSRVWMLAKMAETSLEPVPGDDIRGYFLVMTGHDGTLSFHAKATPIRVVCKNTLNAATGLGSGKKVQDAMFTLRHTKSATDRLKVVEDMVTKLIGSLNATGETFAAMARRQMTAKDVVDYIETVFPKSDTEKEVSKQLADRRAAVSRLVFNGVGAELAMSLTNGQPNAWAVYNAVTEYFDHVRPGMAKTPAARIKANESAVFGQGDDIKLLALKRAAELVTV
jgi:phage/plasmid-like protein (TIGR03299 family)